VQTTFLGFKKTITEMHTLKDNYFH